MRRLVGGACWLVIVAAPAVFAQDPAVSTPTPSAAEEAIADEMVALLNASRDELDLPALLVSPQLSLLAYQHSAEMGRRGRVGHHSHTYGVNTKTRLRLAFPRLQRFAENIASNGSAPRAHAALMASRGHRLNRVDPAFTHVGMAVFQANSYQIFVTELFARATDPSILESIDVLYSEAEPSSLPNDDAHYGEIADETVRIPPPSAEDPEYWTHRGIEAYNEGRYEASIAAFRHALDLDPGYRFARFDLGRTLLAAGDGAAAMEVLREHLATEPGDIDAWSSLGAAGLLQSDFAAAEAAFRRVVAARPRNALAWYNLALTLEYTGRLGDAENAYAQSLHLDPTLAAATAGLARVRR